jgi:cytochrome d ubiquinol oxidase subunit I
MNSALAVDRLQFAFTVTFHYLFPQLTMGLALLIFVLKTAARRAASIGFRDHYNSAARFWIKIFAISFTVGVVTGIPMEFQFGTNWAQFSRVAGGVIGQPLALEGVYSFFLESTFLGLLVFGEKRMSARLHWLSSLALFIGTWLSGYFIIVTDAWMQHPVGYRVAPNGMIELTSLRDLLLNSWALWQYAHNMIASVVTGSFVMTALGAFYLLSGRHLSFGRTFVRFGVVSGSIAMVLLILPAGDRQGKMVTESQPVTLAAMEGLFQTTNGAPIVLIGQPDTDKMRLDNPLTVPKVLSFLTYERWNSEVKGLDAFPKDLWPDNIPLLYYSYHVMVGLGTILLAVMALAAWLLARGSLYRNRGVLWLLMVMTPFPYIATTAGWMTAELGRQPWLIYGVMRTAAGISPRISAGSGLFTLLGFMGIYMVLGILFLFLVGREIEHGPEAGLLEGAGMLEVGVA